MNNHGKRHLGLTLSSAQGKVPAALSLKLHEERCAVLAAFCNRRLICIFLSTLSHTPLQSCCSYTPVTVKLASSFRGLINYPNHIHFVTYPGTECRCFIPHSLNAVAPPSTSAAERQKLAHEDQWHSLGMTEGLRACLVRSTSYILTLGF